MYFNSYWIGHLFRSCCHMHFMIREKWLARNMKMKVHDNSRAVSVKELSLHSIPTNKIAMDLKPALCTSEPLLSGFQDFAILQQLHVHTSENWILNYAHKNLGSTPRVDDKRGNQPATCAIAEPGALTLSLPAHIEQSVRNMKLEKRIIRTRPSGSSTTIDSAPNHIHVLVRKTANFHKIPKQHTTSHHFTKSKVSVPVMRRTKFNLLHSPPETPSHLHQLLSYLCTMLLAWVRCNFAKWTPN